MIKAGLLPLYIKLYDDSSPEARPRLEKFYDNVAAALREKGLDILESPFCRTMPEFRTAVSGFEERGAACIITLHMAYSPSLMSAGALAETKLPIIALDVTETYDFGFRQDPGEIMYNHGIHGVMDMCNLLLRNGKLFAIVAGHWEKSDAIERAAKLAFAAGSAQALRGLRVGRVGDAFEGMGDFYVDDEKLLRDFGIRVVQFDQERSDAWFQISDDELAREEVRDKEAFEFVNVGNDMYRETLKSCLGIRNWREAEQLDAFTVNFLSVRAGAHPGEMPFMEACKAMAGGIGYAGEGDTLTAAFTGALLKNFPQTTFVEIFCPDWAGDSLLLSHMGEMNISLSAAKPVVYAKSFPYTDAADPAAVYACLKAGPAVFANVAPMREGYRLVLAPVDMLDAGSDSFTECIRGWMKPRGPVGRFMEELSTAGATHHSMLVYGDVLEALEFFGKIVGLDVRVIK